jgi:RHS repeat-associated protein
MTGVPYKFTAKEYDPETGLYYFGARYYDARLGRWVSVDPILDKYLPTGDKENDNNMKGQGGVYNSINLSLYSYAANNPIYFIDFFGTDNYVFYDPDKEDGFTKQAHVEANRLKRENNEKTHLIAIKSEDQFKNEWSNMEDPTNVSLVFHGSSKTININWKKRQYLTTQKNSETPKGNPGLYIGDLSRKKISNIRIMSCYGGDVKTENNVARTFLRSQDVSSVNAWDGSLNYWPVLFTPRVEQNSHGSFKEVKYTQNNLINPIRVNNKQRYNHHR